MSGKVVKQWITTSSDTGDQTVSLARTGIITVMTRAISFLPDQVDVEANSLINDTTCASDRGAANDGTENMANASCSYVVAAGTYSIRGYCLAEHRTQWAKNCQIWISVGEF